MAGIKLMLHVFGDVTVVDPNERYIRDPEQVEQFGDALYGLVDQQRIKKMILNFTKVQLFSSAGLGVMMAFRKRADASKCRVVICCVPAELREIFKVVGLDRLFELYADQEKALASFGVSGS